MNFNNTMAAMMAAATFFSRAALAQDDSATNNTYWAVEDAKAREKLPLYQTIPAAKPDELTPANGYPKGKTFSDLAAIARGQRRDALLGAAPNQPRQRHQSSGGLDLSFA